VSTDIERPIFHQSKESVMSYRKFHGEERTALISRVLAGLVGTIIANGSIVIAVVMMARYAARSDA
jgi:hypothetical protein